MSTEPQLNIFCPGTQRLLKQLFLLLDSSKCITLLFCLLLIQAQSIYQCLLPFGDNPVPGNQAGYLHTGMCSPCPIHLNLNDLCGRVILKYQVVLLVRLHISMYLPCPSFINHLGHFCLLPQGRENSGRLRTQPILGQSRRSVALEGTFQVPVRTPVCLMMRASPGCRPRWAMSKD